MNDILRILIVEDSEDDALLVLHQIKKGGYDIEFERVETAKTMNAKIKERTWDIILSDYVLPHFNGLEALELLKESGIDIPFIIISGTIGEDVAVEAMKAGAHDYIMKNNLQRLLPAIKRELCESKNRAERNRAEHQLIESEQKYRSLAESSPDNIIRYDTECRAVYINRNMSLTVASDVVSYIGKTPMESNNFPGTVDYQAILQQVIQTGQPGEIEVVVPDLKGELGVHLIRFVAERNNDSKIIGALAIGRDITERKHAELEIARMNRSLRMLSNVNQALIHFTDEASLLNEVCQIAVGIGGYRLAWVGFAEHDDAKTVKPVAHAGFESGYIESLKLTWADTDRGRGPSGTAIRTGQPFIVHNIQSESSFALWREAAIQHGYKAFIAVPLIYEDQTLGVIAIYSVETDAFDGKEVELLKEMGEDLAFGLTALRSRTKREMAEKALRESEERYRLIAENTADTITVFDLSLNKVYESPSVQKLLGYTVQESISLSLDQLLTPESLQLVNKIFADHMALEASGDADPYRTEMLELEEYCKDGSTIWVEISVSFLRDTNLGSTGLLSVTRDITERKKADELQKAIYRISDAAQTTAKLDKLYGSIHTIIAELMPARNFYISLYNKATETIHFPYFVDEFDTTPSPRKPGMGLTGYVLRTGSPLLTTPQLLEQLVKSGKIEPQGKPPVNWLGVPLKSQHGETIGVMAVQTYTENIRLNISHQNILEFVSAQVAMVIERKRTEEALYRSEEKYRTLVENLSEVIFTLNLQGCFTYISPVIEQYTGFHASHVIGQSFTLFIHPDDLPGLAGSFEDSIAGNMTPFEFRVLDKDGTVRYVRTSSRPMKVEGKIVGLTGIMSDITERKRAEDELRKLSRAVDQSPAMIAITDIQGNIEYVNPRFSEVTGYSRSEAIGQNPRILKSSKVPETLYKEMWDTILGGKVWSNELINRKKNGDYYWVNISISPIFDKDDIISHFVGLAEDITDKKKIEAELIEAKEHAEESDRLKSAFLNNISHEIRTPFNSILGFLSILQNEDLTVDERNKFVEIINKSADRLMNTISDIVEISQIQSGQVKLNISQISLKKLTGDLFRRFNHESQFHGLKLIFENERENDIDWIYTDENKLNTIISNLFSNAIKFTKSGHIQFSIREIGDQLEFSVKDTGMGLRPEKKELIFKTFRQGSESLTRNYEGAGLGLSISKAYVEMLGGNIWVESEVGKGSTFFFTIPQHINI